ncbi:MAG: T9SS type A sorting domain-containing protein [Flavobacteriales bacterium]|nr:T9SS type A sorting domain-containing protein [Flavobacteriales bacterium]
MRSELNALCFSLLTLSSTAQDCADGRYANDLFTTVNSTLAVPFGSNTGVNGGAQTLRMDVYQPESDRVELRPVVLVAFGGSFVAGTRGDVADLCEAFARRGYVAIAPDYRIGFFFPNQTTTSEAVLRGAHDMKACVRYLRRSVAELENPYGIDTTRILAGGISAGAISALHAGYLDQPGEWPSALTSQMASLGGIEGNSGNPGYSSAINGIFSFSGALGDSLWIGTDDLPLCSVHEVGDEVVPYYTQEVEVFGIPTGLMASGSHDIHQRMDHLGLENCLLTYPGTGHVGYLSSDPVASVEFVLNFCANLVCGQVNTCELINAVADASDNSTTIFPNPTTGPLTIVVDQPEGVVVTDLAGRTLLHARVDAVSSNIDLTSLGAGIYLVRVGAHQAMRCIVVE